MSEESKPHVVKLHDIRLDSDYVSWVHDVKQRYVSAQIKSAVKVNTEQLFFNWQLGRDLVERKAEEKWGKGIVEQLSLDLQNEFPKAKGFSARNLWNMKKWYLFYSGNENFSELAHHMEESLDMKGLKLQQVGMEIDEKQKLHQLGAEMEFFYDFGVVSLPAGYDEKELKDALEQNITRFLLELGSGFAFVGRQKEIIVAGKTRKIDMLFYHIKLRCYVVVELKAVSFEPEFAGKLNFYVNAVNQLMKTDDDNPTIGLLICKDKNQTEVQWAFQGIETPMGVATYDNIRMNEIKSQLPSEEAIQKRLEQAEEEYLLKLQEKNK